MCPYIYIFNLTIPAYGLCMALAAIVVVSFAAGQAKRKQILKEDVLIVSATGGGLALVGAKLMYIIVSFSIDDIVGFIRRGDFEFLGGSGLVFLGGLLLAIPGAWLGSRLAQRKLSDFEGLIVPILPVGHAIGRIGCLMAGCCYGALYNGPFAVHYKNMNNGLWTEEGYFPIQPLESILNCVIAIILYIKSRKEYREYFLLLDYIMYYSIIRFCLEFLRGDAARGIYMGLSTSQWLCIALFVFNIGIRIVAKKRN